MRLRILFRRGWRHGGLVAAVVVAAAMPIAVNASLFTILDGLRFRDLPFVRPGELIAVDYRRAAGAPPELAYHPRLAAERDSLRRSLETSPMVEGAAQVGFASFFGPAAMGIEAAGVDSRFFRLLGLRPVLGRTFDLADERSPATLSQDSDAPLPVVVGYHFWRDEFGGDPDVLEGVHRVGGRHVRVIGVMPAGVKFPDETNVWAPVAQDRARPPAIVRLATGATIEGLARSFPQLTFLPLRESVRPGDTRSITLLLIAATLLVIVAWVQVAALAWSGIVGRLPELGISVALGASRTRLLGQFLVEGALVASFVVFVVLLSTPALTTLLVGNLPHELRVGQYLSPGPRTFAFVLALCGVGLMILALVPLHLVRRASALSLLSGRAGQIAVGAARARRAFLVGQIAITTCLVYASGLVVHSQVQAETFDHGFDTDHVLVFWPPESGRHPTTRSEVQSLTADRRRLVLTSIDRLNASGAVRAAADVQAIRLTGLISPIEEPITEFDGRRLHPEVRVWSTGAGPAFLKALGGRLTAGSGFDEPQHAGRADVAIINETLARILSPADTLMGIDVRKPVLGARISTRFFQGEIIGVAKDLVDSSPAFPARPQMFVPSAHPAYEAGTVTVNAQPPLTASVPVIRAILEEVWGPLPAGRLGLMHDELRLALAPFRARSTLLSLIAILCLPLAAMGLAGALLCSIRTQERETAIRIALGGDPQSVRRAVITHALLLVGAGLLPGIALGAALGRIAAHQLFNVHPIDPLTLVAVAGGFLLIGWAAALIPSRRASHVHPASILRSS